MQEARQFPPLYGAKSRGGQSSSRRGGLAGPQSILAAWVQGEGHRVESCLWSLENRGSGGTEIPRIPEQDMGGSGFELGGVWLREHRVSGDNDS